MDVLDVFLTADFFVGVAFLEAVVDVLAVFLTVDFFVGVPLAPVMDVLDIFLTADFFVGVTFLAPVVDVLDVFLTTDFFVGAPFLAPVVDFLVLFLTTGFFDAAALVAAFLTGFLYRGFLYLSGFLSIFTNSINVKRNAVIAKLKNKIPAIIISVLPMIVSLFFAVS